MALHARVDDSAWPSYI